MLNVLNILPPDLEPRATEHIDEIIQLIERLLAKGYVPMLATMGMYTIKCLPI